MVAGWDPTGPAIYYVDSEGQRTRGKVFSVGSGSLYAYGVLDNGYKWCGTNPRLSFLSLKPVEWCQHMSHQLSFGHGSRHMKSAEYSAPGFRVVRRVLCMQQQ